MQAPVRIVFYLRVREPWTAIFMAVGESQSDQIGLMKIPKMQRIQQKNCQNPESHNLPMLIYLDLFCSWDLSREFQPYLGNLDSDLEEIQRLDGDIQDTAIHKNHGDGDFRSQKIKAGNLEILGWHMVTYIWHIIYNILWKHFSESF